MSSQSGSALRFNSLRASLTVGLGLLLLGPAVAYPKVFYAKDEALKLAFPDADQIEMRTLIMEDPELKKAQQMARTRIDSKLFTFYVGKKKGAVIGYAAIDTHIVRTLPETFMVVLSPEGQVQTTVVLAFHEPPEYLPSERWLEQFHNKTLSPDLWVGRDIAGIAGSTLTTQAITQGIRKVVALFQILIKEKR
ncbi:MAG: FMN-binding protein [Deltaproteobacteria bacterium]|nr:FMN-binding protein [Deltaproteobacteria bacterium]